ncbi:MAG: hypothetical protein HOP11_11140, partial [Saprospiraceae bacterium]|nr:hypothetical protein [Saprospiraceae bacterium]
VSATTPTTGQVLKYNGSVWLPDTDETGGGTNYYQTLRDDGAAQIQRGKINFIASSTIGTTLTDDSGNDETEVSLAILSNSIDSNMLKNGSVTLNKIYQEGATSNQYLKWNGSNWRPSTIAASEITNFYEIVNDEIGAAVIAGTGISVSFNDGANNTTITNTGDLSNTNEAWTIDADDADTEVISNQTLKFEGAGIITTDYIPASDKIIITGTEVDGSTTNELQTFSHSGTTSYTNTLSNGGGSFTLQSSGIATISNTAGTVIIGATEVDGSTTNELQTLSASGAGPTSYNIDLSNGGGSVTLTEGANVDLTRSGNNITITASGIGEANTASNIGTGGVGVWKDKSGVDLRFKKVNAGSSKVIITDDTGNNEVDIDVIPANFTGIPQLGVTSLTTDLDAKQPDIQYKDEGINIGSSGGVTALDFVGGGVTSTYSSGTVTVTVPNYEVSDGDKTDITVSGSGLTWNIDADVVGSNELSDNSVTNVELADMATATFKGRTTAGTGNPEDLTIAQAKTMLNLIGTNSGDQNLSYNSGTHAVDITTGTSAVIPLALADGATEGLASFTAADFNATSGNISLDYTNAQKATAGQNGFLTSTDWSTFNNKLSAEVDGSISNEGSLTVGVGTGTTSLIQSNTSGSTNITIEAGTNITLIETGNTITISAAASGETNTASNLGGGLPNYDSKSGVDLRFNSFGANDFNIASNLISIDYTNGQSASGSTKGFLTSADWLTFNNKVNTSRSINTTSPLSGGGDLSSDRTITTSMSTNKLIGRYSAGTGVMQEITISTGLNLDGSGNLTATSSGGDINQNGNSFANPFRIGSNDNQSVNFEIQDTIAQIIETSGNITYTTKVANNNNTLVDRFVINTNSHGTPTVGFGSAILFKSESSTTEDQEQAQLYTSWINATHASRKSQFGVKLTTDGGALTDVMRITNYGEMYVGSSNPCIVNNTGLHANSNSGINVTDNGFNGTTTISANNKTAGEAVVIRGGDVFSATAYNLLGWNNFVPTSGIKKDFKMLSGFAPTSGTATFYPLSFEGTINQTGGANGVSGGIYFNPTLTSATDYRALHSVTNNANAHFLYQEGANTKNYLQGVLKLDNYTDVKEIAAPGTPSTGYGRIYEKTDNLLYFKNDAGVEYDLTAVGSVTSNSLSLSGNTMTTNVNGVSDTSLVIGTNVLSISGNTMTTNVNSKTDTSLIIGTNALTFSSSSATLTSTVNGVATSATSLKYGIDSVYYYPENYGAILNDANDDRAAIQAAIDSACNRGGGIVWLNKGEFRVTTTASRGSYASGLHVCSNVTLRGTGQQSIIRSTITTAGQHVISLAHSSVNIKLIDFQIKPDSLPSGASVFASIGTTNFTMQRVKIDRGSCWGVLLKESKKGTIIECDIQNGGSCHGIEINNCQEMKILNNYIYSNTTRDYHPSRGNGIESFFNQSGENHPYKNLISGNTVSNTGGGIVIWGDSCTTVSNNIITRISGHGMTVVTEKDAPGETWNRDIRIIGNQISMVGNVSNSNVGLLIEALNQGIIVEGNHIDSVYTNNSGQGGGLGIENRAEGTIISGNVVEHAYVNGINNSGKQTVINNNRVYDCSILNSGFRGISNSGNNCTIVGNSVHETRASGNRQDMCIYITGNNNTSCANNTSGGTSGDQIQITGTGNVQTGDKE